MTATVRSQTRTPCACTSQYSLRNSQRHCMECGGFNPKFTMEAYRVDNPSLPFGFDCGRGHMDLQAAIVEFPQSPYCEHCGYKAKAPT